MGCEFVSEVDEDIVSDFDAFFNSSGDDVFGDMPAGAAGHPGSWASPRHGPANVFTEQGLQMQLSEGTKLGDCSGSRCGIQMAGRSPPSCTTSRTTRNGMPCGRGRLRGRRDPASTPSVRGAKWAGDAHEHAEAGLEK